MLDREAVDRLASHADVADLEFSDKALTDEAVALLGFQRTKTISPKSRKAWMAGNREPLLREASTRRDDIFASALLEVYREYIPVKRHLDAVKFTPKSIIDIGCGQAIPDLFLQRDFKPRFTLIDIEQTDDQYHAWADSGSGYASLADAKAMLHDNGAAKTKVRAINPIKTPDQMNGLTADMLISFYSCGFHYPVDEYANLMEHVISEGGMVMLDLRKRYLKRRSETLDRVFSAGTMSIIYDDERSQRIAIANR